MGSGVSENRQLATALLGQSERSFHKLCSFKSGNFENMAGGKAKKKVGTGTTSGAVRQRAAEIDKEEARKKRLAKERKFRSGGAPFLKT